MSCSLAIKNKTAAKCEHLTTMNRLGKWDTRWNMPTLYSLPFCSVTTLPWFQLPCLCEFKGFWWLDRIVWQICPEMGQKILAFRALFINSRLLLKLWACFTQNGLFFKLEHSRQTYCFRFSFHCESNLQFACFSPIHLQCLTLKLIPLNSIIWTTAFILQKWSHNIEASMCALANAAHENCFLFVCATNRWMITRKRRWRKPGR